MPLSTCPIFTNHFAGLKGKTLLSWPIAAQPIEMGLVIHRPDDTDTLALFL